MKHMRRSFKRTVKGLGATIALTLWAIRDLLLQGIPLHRKAGGFVFLVHPRDLEDAFRKYPFLRRLPPSLVERILRHLWPVVLSEVTGLRGRDGKPIRGWMLACPMTAKQIMAEPKRAKRRVAQALRLAARLGARVAGLGVLIPSLTRYGVELENRWKLAVTTGQAFTAATVLPTIYRIAPLVELDLSRATVAVVGASGSIGRCVSRILAAEAGRLVLVARNRQPLEEAAKQIRTECATEVVVSTALEAVREADLVITVTNATRYLVRPEHLKFGAVVLDYAQPPNVSPEVCNRRDVLLLWGGLIHTPGIRCHFDFGLLDRGDVFACLAETLVLSREDQPEALVQGPVEPVQAARVWRLSRELQFEPARFQRFGRPVPPKTFEAFRAFRRAVCGPSKGEEMPPRSYCLEVLRGVPDRLLV